MIYPKMSGLRHVILALPLLFGGAHSAHSAETPKTEGPKAEAPKAETPKAVSTPATTAPLTTTAPAPLDNTVKLANGLTLVTRLDRTAPRIAISLLVRASAADETSATAGWRRVLANAMLRASYNSLATPPAAADTKPDAAAKPEGEPAPPTGPDKTPSDAAPTAPPVLTGVQLQRLAEAVGGQVGASVGDDVIEFWATGDSRNAGALLDLLLNLVEHPRLSDDDVATAIKFVAADTIDDSFDIALSATASLRTQIYRDQAGKPIAYGLPKSTPETLHVLTPAKIRAFYHAYIQPSQFFAGVAGDIDAAALRKRFEEISPSPTFAGATAEVPAPGAVPTFYPAAKTNPPLVVKQLPTQDAWVFISFLTAKSNDADAAAVEVFSAALGESPMARLPRRLLSKMPALGSRPDDDTALQTSVSLTPRHFGSEFVVYAQGSSSNVDSLKNALLDEIRKMRDASLSDDELMRAKNFVRGSIAVDRESLRERSFNAALAPATNAPADDTWNARVLAVTAADVRRVAGKYTQNYAVALIMPQD